MHRDYPLYDAKANLSRIVKQVREGGESVVITVHGEPAVEIIAYRTPSSNLVERLAEMVARGDVVPASASPREYVYTPRKPARKGGLKRFLDERREE